MKYNRIKKILIKILKFFLRPIARIIFYFLHRLECALSDQSNRPLPNRPILIIGAPRTGSTLLYQVLTENLDVGYMSNYHCRYYFWPSLIERLVHPLKWRTPTDFSSRFGKTQRKTEPSECGAYWYRFFRTKPQYVPLEEVDPKAMSRLRGSMRRLIKAFGRPILFKNLNNALRLRPLASALPEALFIVIERDLKDTANSLLAGRKSIFGTYDQWWSMEPPDIENIRKKPPHIQVVEQVLSIYRLIDEDAEYIGKNRFLKVNYKSLCDNPGQVMIEIDNFFRAHKLHVGKRGDIPKSFTIQENNNIT